MKFTTIFFSAVMALGVCAQNVTTTPAPASTVPLTPAQSSEKACLTACAPTDTECRNKCVSAGGAINPIALCQGSCFQGNGTSSDDANYKACIQNCIDTSGGSYAISATPTSAAPSGAATGVETVSGSEPATGSAGSTPTASESSTATGTSSSATASKSSAADIVQVGSSFVGLLGMLAAMVAL